MVEMKVKTIAVDAETRHPVMILTDAEEKHYLPIWIGNPEAQAILFELEGFAPPRPMTHDLIKLLLDQMNMGLKRVVVNDLQDSTYFARLVLENDGKESEVDARPSDSVALALRFKAPIFVAEKVMQAALPNKEKIAEDNKKFKEFIAHVSPEMFTTPPAPPSPKGGAED